MALHQHHSLKLIWYASCGSNVNLQRLMCYIEGGLALGSTEPNQGCRDKNPPLDSRSIVLNFDLYFAGRSRKWSNGGVAFIREGTGQAPVLGRVYLITDEQFNDVVMQENSVTVDGPPIRPGI